MTTEPIQFHSGYTIDQGVTQSMLRDFLACRIRMRMKLDSFEKPGEKRALRYGSMTHDALQHVYEAVQQARANGVRGYRMPTDLAFGTLKESIDRSFDKNTSGLYVGADASKHADLRTEADMAEAVLKEYFLEWPDDLKTNQWFGVEQMFDVDFHGFRLRGKIDGIRNQTNGDLTILETKTSSKINEMELSTKLTFDYQCLFYMLALRLVLQEQGDNPKRLKGVQYNVIRTPQIKQGKTQSSADYIARIAQDTYDRHEFYFKRWNLRFEEIICRLFV